MKKCDWSTFYGTRRVGVPACHLLSTTYHLPPTLCGLLAVAFLLLIPRPGEAAEAPEGSAKFAGKVMVTQRDGAGPSAATFSLDRGQVYNLVMDEKGRSLGGVMHNTTAEIFAVPSEKDGARWLRVLDYVDPMVTAGHEFWRRMRCNACVVLPATVNAAVPADLHGAIPLAGRDYSFKRKFSAWARDDKFLWAAADNQIIQIDFAQQSLVRSYGRADGLPDQLIYQLLSDGKTLWIVHREGVAALSIGADKIAGLPRLKARYARAFADAGGVWIIAESGTFRLAGGTDTNSRQFGNWLSVPPALPPLPTAARIARAVENGIWTPHWERRTAPFVSSVASLSGKLCVCSWGDIYELDAGKWEKIGPGGCELRTQATGGGPAGAERLWFMDAKGLVEYDPASKKCTPYEPPEGCRGRCAQLVLTAAAAWLAMEPAPSAAGAVPAGGGLARLDLATHTWQTWPEINGRKAQEVSALTADGGNVWAVTMDGRYIPKSAHPGMTTTIRQSFGATSFCLHNFGEKEKKWESYPFALPELDNRLICGQDGCRGMDAIIPQYLQALSIGPNRIFAAGRLVPKQYFGGYWPCIEQVASRAPSPFPLPPGEREGVRGPWLAKCEHHPEQLELQGEQPLVLNISNGELTRIGSDLQSQLWEAVGHDLVLGLFCRDGRHWAVSEGCIGYFDEAAGSWRKLAGTEFRWYWRATAALEEGRWLFIGSDRGLFSRLDIETGRFELLGALKDRSISRIARNAAGEILIASKQAPLGVLPVQLAAKLQPLDMDAARFDGKSFTPAKLEDVPSTEGKPQWFFRNLGKKDPMDKSQGNYLCGPLPQDAEAKPRYYVKEVFYPQFLCASSDGSRMWISTYTGLVRLDLKPQMNADGRR